ncbi:Hypothetical protein A7982_10532 [Minicystis rosea]|nr:Hypothetical protein A7982_10532 [Minicystis rosea]
MAEPLGQVADPAVLDADPRPRARLRLDVEAAWLTEGADLEITSPIRLPCARCDGGGCDACNRSGVLRAPEEAASRLFTVRVPPQPEGGDAVALRIPEPFGPEHAIGQLIVELHAAAEPSPTVRRLDPPAPLAPTGLPARIPPLAIAVIVTLAGILAALLSR